METNLYYISFSGNRDNVSHSLVRQVHSILLQEYLCLQLDDEDKNWLVFSDKDDLRENIIKSVSSDRLRIKALPVGNPLSAHIAHIKSSLANTRQTLLDTINKNGTLLEENTLLKIARYHNPLDFQDNP